jgi:filamentous hemagglutinin family protein
MSTLAVSGVVTAPVTDCVVAQIIPDNTLPINSSVPVGCTNCTIEGGTIRGVNLYHSFREFSVQSGGTARFNNPPQIQVIFTRVTGGSISNIDGLIRTNGSASLFLLNPNGILFGPNARLAIDGSFTATTASHLKFPGGSEFSAINPQAPPQLIVNVTPGIQYGPSRAGATITSTGNLSVGQDLTLDSDRLNLQGQFQAGRDVTLQTQDKVQVQGASLQVISGGSVTYGTVVFNVVGGDPTNLDFTLRSDKTITGVGDISVFDPNGAGGLLVDFQSKGNINIQGITTNGGNIKLVSTQNDVKTANLNTANFEDGGNIYLSAKEDVFVKSIISSEVAVDEQGKIVLISDTGGVIEVFSGGKIVANSVFTAAFMTAGSINLEAANGNITFDSLDSRTTGSASFNVESGTIRVVASKGKIISSGALTSDSVAGSGGNIHLEAANEILIDGNIFSFTGSSPTGNEPLRKGGDITITSTTNGDVSITGSVRSNAFFRGNPGEITIISKNGSITVGNPEDNIPDGIDTSSCQGIDICGNQNAGKIRLEATNGNIATDIISAVSDLGNGGDITLLTTNGNVNVELIRAYTYPKPGTGFNRAGNVEIAAAGGSLDLGEVFAFSTDGQGGDVTLRSTNGILVNSINTTGKVGSGNITVNTDGAFTTRFRSKFRGGNRLPLSSVITSDTFGSSDGGDINITARSISLLEGAQISASTHNSGDGGNITLRAADFMKIDGIAPERISPGVFAPTGEATILPNGIPILPGVLGDRFLGGYVRSGNSQDRDASSPQLFPSGVFAQTTVNPTKNEISTGDAGKINIETGRLIIQNQGAIAATTFGSGKGGDIEINAQRISLNQGSILAGLLTFERPRNASSVAESGNIELNVKDFILLRRKSLISTNASSRSSAENSGNITITSPSIVAPFIENSDIVANASTGKGGKVTVNASGIFGLVPRSREELQELLDGKPLDPQNLPTNDITAFSQGDPTLNGEVILNTPDADPTRGLVPLPLDLADATRLIAQRCPSSQVAGNTSEFIVTGRGGFPPTPDDRARSSSVMTPWVSLENSSPRQSDRAEMNDQNQRASHSPDEIVEAQGWVRDKNGTIVLVAKVPTAASPDRWMNSDCDQSQLPTSTYGAQ